MRNGYLNPRNHKQRGEFPVLVEFAVQLILVAWRASDGSFNEGCCSTLMSQTDDLTFFAIQVVILLN